MQYIKFVSTIAQREIIRYVRDRSRIVATFFQPLMFLFIFGTGLRDPISSGNLGVDFIKFMYPGIIAMNVMGISFFSSISTVWDREFGFLKEILVAPVPRSTIVLGKALGAMAIASIQASILLLISPLIKISLSFSVVVELFLIMLILSFAISGMSLLISALMRSVESFGVLMQLFIFPMFFLSGAFFPLTSVPKWMEILSRLDPLTYGVDAMRQVMLGSQAERAALEKLVLHPVYIDIIFLLSFSLVMVGVSILAFRKKD